MQPSHGMVAEPFVWSRKAHPKQLLPQSQERAWLRAWRDSARVPVLTSDCCIPSRV